ncbi:MAG: sodium:dicarboxylate symporter [Clostridiaceae bacterium BRH_c20a]|nr:MAG: sodium:dicarboxylate symporter [Clostridiaceae bacterium BRH_c20a]
MGKMKLSTKILLGLGLGILVGLFVPADFANTFIKPIGTLFLRLIKMVIVPLVFASLVVGASSVGDIKKLGRMGGKTVGYYLVTTAIAVIIGLTLANIMVPGAGLELPVDAKYEGKQAPSIVNVLLEVIPDNPLGALVNGSMLQIIAFALFIGIGITLVGEKSNVVKNFFDGFAEVMYRITGIVMEFAPYGVFGLIVPVVAQYGLDVLAPLAMVILAVYLGCIIHGAVVYSAAVKFIGKMSPLTFYKGILPAQVIAFSTCSSAGTLPATIKSVEENLGVSNDVASFVLPLGATINMDGTAVYQGICALFVAQVYGLDLSLGQQLTVVLVGTLASIGAAGVPGAGLIMLTMTLTAVNLPLDGIALVAGIDRILDMARTTLNVTGDASAAVVVAATEGELNIPVNSNLSV